MVSYHPAQIEERVRKLEEKVATALQKE
jgi:hypothetical protein